MINMTRATLWLFSLLVAMTFVFGLVTDAEARGKRGRFRKVRKPAPSYAQTYNYLNSYYPKYYYGFHSSYIHNMGIPSGDIGLRGNGVMMSPW